LQKQRNYCKGMDPRTVCEKKRANRACLCNWRNSCWRSHMVVTFTYVWDNSTDIPVENQTAIFCHRHVSNENPATMSHVLPSWSGIFVATAAKTNHGAEWTYKTPCWCRWLPSALDGTIWLQTSKTRLPTDSVSQVALNLHALNIWNFIYAAFICRNLEGQSWTMMPTLNWLVQIRLGTAVLDSAANIRFTKILYVGLACFFTSVCVYELKCTRLEKISAGQTNQRRS